MPSSVFLTLDPEQMFWSRNVHQAHMQMFRLGGQSHVNSPVFSSQASLILIYRPTEGVKGRVTTLPIPGFEPLTCDMEAQYTTTQSPGFTYYTLAVINGILRFL
ncbi:hypothetical protein TNCV_1040801 [Trichonephila clavipes]|nr:hypothetical protein TNCV_1040801 [Trichonephila clavipes]